jgi:hypothetical protein
MMMVFVEVMIFVILEVEVVQKRMDGHHVPACSNCNLHHDHDHSLIWTSTSQATYNKNTITMENSKRWLTPKMVLMELESGQ